MPNSQTKAYYAQKAREHNTFVDTHYAAETAKSVSLTKIYSEDFKKTLVTQKSSTQIILEDQTTVSALFKHHSDKIALLNFACYYGPGGLYLNGYTTQEESLCHNSNLYSILKEFTISYYMWNDNNRNKALYKNRALYTPNVIFF